MAFNNTSHTYNDTNPLNEDYSASEKAALIFAMVLISVLAIPGNCMVVYVISRVQNMRTSTNILLLNLCIADLLTAVLYLPFITVDLYVTDSWIFGGFMCKFVSFSQSVGTKASVLILTALSMERYISICKPSLTLVTIRKARMVCVFLWVIAMVAALPLFIVKATVQFDNADHYFCIESWSLLHAKVYTVVLLALFYVVPLLFMTILYVKIGQKLRQSAKTTSSMRLTGKATTSSMARLTKICVAIILSFALSWAPTHGLTLTYYFAENISDETILVINMIVFPIVLCISFSNCAVNPLLYCFMSQNFRNALVGEWKRLANSRKRSSWNRLPGISRRSRSSTFRTMSSRVFEQQGSSPNSDGKQPEKRKGLKQNTLSMKMFESAL